MKVRVRVTWLQAQGFGKFRSGLGEARFLRQDRTHFVVQVCPLGVEFGGLLQLGSGALEVSGEAQHTSQRAMGLRVLRGKANRFAGCRDRLLEIALLSQSAGQAGFGLRKICLQL